MSATRSSKSNTRTSGPSLSPGDLLLGIDPGPTTGICLAEYSGRIDIQPLMSLNWEEKDWTDLLYLLRATRPKVTVCEYFRVYANKGDDIAGSDLLSLQIIGALKGWNAHPQTRFSDSLVFPMASEIQAYEVLPHHRGLICCRDPYTEVRSLEHRKDAYKHIRRYVAKTILRG
jgi:hypothetical protein